MTLRVNTSEVKEIFETNITDLVPFITAANTVINDQLATEISNGSVSSATLKEMERWLAAHFASARDQRPVEEKLGEATMKYQGTSGEGLLSTTYGQMAMELDPTGQLAGGKRRRAEMTTVDFLNLA
jgi:hypothetical protein